MAALRTLLVSLVLLAVGIGVVAAATDGFRAYTTETARRIRVSEYPRELPPLALQAADGAETSFGELRGRWLLVDFIYTRCMTFCSVQGSEFARLQRQLAAPIAADKVVLLSVSFDLDQDNLAALAEYQRSRGGHTAGWITARPVDNHDLAKLMRVFGVVVIPDGMDGFVHNAAIAVVDPGGRLVAILDWDDMQEAANYVTERLAR